MSAPTPPELGPPKPATPVNWKELLGAFRQASSLASMLSLFTSGVILSCATMTVGGPFAMGIAMYLGNLEPAMPHAAYPWGIAGMALAVWLFGLFLEYRLGRPWLGVVLSHCGAVVWVFAPILHLYRLWAAT